MKFSLTFAFPKEKEKVPYKDNDDNKHLITESYNPKDK